MESYVLVEKIGAVGKLILNRPEKLNAVIGGMREEIISSLQALSEDSKIRVVVITGAGRAFCAGGDIHHLRELVDSQNLEGLKEMLFLGKSLVTLIRKMPKPVLAAVNGPAAGAGLNLALSCDIRIASEKAVFGASFSKIGLHPDWGGSWFLPRLAGPSRALELIFTGEPIDAQEAYRIGLVNHVYSETEFYPAVDKLCAALAARPPQALALAKTLVWESCHWGLEETLESEIQNQIESFQTKDAREGIHAFLEKRAPVFSGE
jgi:2-(1,2-epoxy-1,2-dihydrophenyl)acetyl-CoA isomerase